MGCQSDNEIIEVKVTLTVGREITAGVEQILAQHLSLENFHQKLAAIREIGGGRLWIILK